MNYSEAKSKLESVGQQHLLRYFDELTEQQKQSLLDQIDSLDLNLLRQQQDLLSKPKKVPKFSPYQKYSLSGDPQNISRGKDLISEGKVGCLLIAGGQGTRLKLDGPKGAYPITPIKEKSLFQLFAEKTLAASECYGRSLSLAIMVSPNNQEQTLEFFEKNDHFGLLPDFFTQANLPLLTPDDDLFLDEKYHMAEGPDGNGFALSHFYRSSIYQKWMDQGIEYVNMVLIDNPLADPFDAELIGFHDSTKADVVIKAVKRKDPQEKVGVIVQKDNQPHVIEYTELPPDPNLEHPLANISLFSFPMKFIREVADKDLPLHVAFKAVPALEEDGEPHRPDTPNAFKFERFIFDVLPFSQKTETLVYPREECFAPLKNIEGEGSPESVRQALQNRDRQIFKQLTGNEPPDHPFELSQQFYYPTPELLKRWENKPAPKEDYLT